MYKAFSNQLRWMALGSIGTIIGLMIGNVLPLFAVNEGERTFDTIACKQIAILRDDGGISGIIGTNPENQSGYIFLKSIDGCQVIVSSAEELDNNRSGLVAVTSVNRMASFHVNKSGEGKIITTDIEESAP